VNEKGERSIFFSGTPPRSVTQEGPSEERRTLKLDAETFRSLFEAHSAFVWRVLARHGVRPAELEDACQEVFLVVHARFTEFEGRSSVRTWIYGVAVRVALGFRRKSARRRESLAAEPEEEPVAASQLESALQRQTLRLIERALSDMEADKREVFALYELEGMTMAEVASTLGVPENTALYRLYSARDEIRSALRRHEQRGRAHVPSTLRRMAP
jgi:RNA polymerase sigma-70 factor (ECF subfamily)